jgi:hypothetical protein
MLICIKLIGLISRKALGGRESGNKKAARQETSFFKNELWEVVADDGQG